MTCAFTLQSKSKDPILKVDSLLNCRFVCLFSNLGCHVRMSFVKIHIFHYILNNFFSNSSCSKKKMTTGSRVVLLLPAAARLTELHGGEHALESARVRRKTEEIGLIYHLIDYFLTVLCAS